MSFFPALCRTSAEPAVTHHTVQGCQFHSARIGPALPATHNSCLGIECSAECISHGSQKWPTVLATLLTISQLLHGSLTSYVRLLSLPHLTSTSSPNILTCNLDCVLSGCSWPECRTSRHCTLCRSVCGCLHDTCGRFSF